MPAINTVLFDLDGTLIDSIDLILSSYRHTMVAHGFPDVPDAEWLKGVGTPLRAQLGPWARDDSHLEALVATYRDYNLSNHDTMVRADDVTNAKPHPEPVNRAVALLSADPATTLFVGDSIHDLHSGRGAGVLTGAVLWGPFRRAELEPATPDYWFELPEHLERLLLS